MLWEWLGPGGPPGLQNLWRVALRAAVGSTPIHSRLPLDDRQWTMVDRLHLHLVPVQVLSMV